MKNHYHNPFSLLNCGLLFPLLLLIYFLFPLIFSLFLVSLFFLLCLLPFLKAAYNFVLGKNRGPFSQHSATTCFFGLIGTLSVRYELFQGFLSRYNFTNCLCKFLKIVEVQTTWLAMLTFLWRLFSWNCVIRHSGGTRGEIWYSGQRCTCPREGAAVTRLRCTRHRGTRHDGHICVLSSRRCYWYIRNILFIPKYSRNALLILRLAGKDPTIVCFNLWLAEPWFTKFCSVEWEDSRSCFP